MVEQQGGGMLRSRPRLSIGEIYRKKASGQDDLWEEYFKLYVERLRI